MVHGIGPMLGRQLIRAFGTVQLLWSASALQLQRIEGLGPKLIESIQAEQHGAAMQLVSLCRQQGIGILCPDDQGWPTLLAPIDDAPLVLFVRGDISHLNHDKLLAVVGARRATHEGRGLTRRWCRYLSEQGVGIVSGMATGIDSAAHRGALEGGSPTIAVLGCGLCSLTEEQQRQVEAVTAQGCVVSEFLPLIAPRPEYFPRRNRIIAGLTQATLVMEADIKSGSLITARQAADYGREVMAVPGSVLAGNHAGCHLLIREGSALAESADSIMQHMSWQTYAADQKSNKRGYVPASDQEGLILRSMAREIMHVDAIAESCGLTMPELSPILLALELQGVVERLPGSRYLLAVELTKK
ncbi:MAG TPA: DNA-processing protein DprA [Mariprofundaceae bacterium]|nr:DNA-processing protein DprA [Mariprofundaceae bacterium]